MAFPVVRGMRGLELGNPGAMRQWLNGLVLEGRKRATAGLMSEYLDEGEPVEEPGELLALVDDNVDYVATVRVTRVDVSTLAEVPDGFALAEGEGDLRADDFRSSHQEYWAREGIAVDARTVLVLVYFELVDGS